MDGEEPFGVESCFSEAAGEFVGDSEHGVGVVALGQRKLVRHQAAQHEAWHRPSGPRLHKAGEEIEKVHHYRHTEIGLELAGGDGGDGVLRQDGVERDVARGASNEPPEPAGVGEVLERAKPGVSPHFPAGEGVGGDAETRGDGVAIGEVRTEQVHLVAALGEFDDEVVGFCRAAAAGRIKRFVREQGQSHRAGVCREIMAATKGIASACRCRARVARG